MARRKSVSNVIPSRAAVTMLGSKKRNALRSSALARYMAMSAFLINSSVSSPSPG